MPLQVWWSIKGGDLSSFSVKGSQGIGGGLRAGARIRVGDQLKKLGVSGSLLGAEDGLAQIYAGSMGKVSVKGNVQSSRILAGADLGDDWAPGGTGADEDSFAAGSIGKFSVRGKVEDSLIGAGLKSHDNKFDLAWLRDNNAFIDGSLIKSVSIKVSLTSSATEGMPFGIGSYEVRKVRVGRAGEHPLVVSET